MPEFKVEQPTSKKDTTTIHSILPENVKNKIYEKVG